MVGGVLVLVEFGVSLDGLTAQVARLDLGDTAGSLRVELSTMVLGLAPGRLLAFVGARSDIPGVDAAEIAVLDDVVHANGRSTLVLQAPLQYGYVRDGLRIHANVVAATHGESVQEVLGNGLPFLRNKARQYGLI